MPLSIVKPSFWKSYREVRDASNALVGWYKLSNAWQTKAEGEVQGRRFHFSYVGWDGRYSQMTDTSGHVIARIEPIGWWGTWYKLTYNGKEYRWRMNGWGTESMMYDVPTQAGGETEIVRVRPGGYFKPGTVTVHRPMDTKELIPLVLYSIYQQHVIASQSAASGGGAS